MLINKIDETVININFWKEIQYEMNNVLRDLKGIVLLAHNSIEFVDIIDLLNKIKPEHITNVLYISLVRTYDFLKLALNQKPFDNKRIFFIDCVSGFAFTEEDKIDDAIYHEPPSDLIQMKELVKFGIEKTDPEIVVIDSLTQFMDFSMPTEYNLNDLHNFLQSLKSDFLNINQDTFILLYDSRMSFMQNLPKLSVDQILKVEILKEKTRWKD